MLRIRLEGCGTSKEIGQVSSVRIEADSLQALEHGELARYEDGYWRHTDGEDFISVVVDARCQVHFEEAAERSGPWGPYERLRSAGGSLWASDPRRDHLLARYGRAEAKWHCLLDPRRPWPTVVVEPVGKTP